MNVDEGQWVNIHDQAHFKQSPGERIPVFLNFPTSRLIVTVVTLNNKPWLRAGWLIQEWKFQLETYANVSRHKLPLSQHYMVNIEPVASSRLWIETMDWITDFYLSIDAQQP